MWDYLTHDTSATQKILFVIVLSLFLPMIPSAAIMLLMMILLFIKGDVVKAYKNIKGSYFVLFFTLLELIVTLVYKNYPGFGFTFLLLLFFSIAIVFREYMDVPFFHLITKTIMYLSVGAGIYGFIEYINILHEFNIYDFQIIVFNTPIHRINSVYFNSNYYAMMINFFIGITFYHLLDTIKKPSFSKKEVFTMSGIILFNMFILYLTGCRTAWPALLVGLLVILFFAHFYKLFGSVMLLGGAGAIFMATHPQLISRFSNIEKYLGVRRHIWHVSIQNIKSHPLFGEGPMTYWHIYKNYPHAHPTQHAHNIFIDPVLSFGVLGIALLSPYFIKSIQGLRQLRKSHQDNVLYGLIVSFVVMTIIHGFLDYTIFFVQTSTLFLIIIGSFNIYNK